MANAPDLKQVAALFNDCIERLRNQSQEGNEKVVEDWLKEARHDIMRQIETKYYELAASIDNPVNQPTWALDPSIPLYIFSIHHPAALQPYSSQIITNLDQLAKSCGFAAEVHCCSGSMSYNYAIIIRFPAKLNDSPNRQSSRTIQVGAYEADILGRMRKGLIQAGTSPTDLGSSEDKTSEDTSESNGSDDESLWIDITAPTSPPLSTISTGSSP